jgi:hypothetical protein
METQEVDLEILETAPTAGPEMGAEDGGMLPDEVAAMFGFTRWDGARNG